jgi:hypothetical protein
MSQPRPVRKGKAAIRARQHHDSPGFADWDRDLPEDFELVLGPDCPLLQRLLFVAVCDGNLFIGKSDSQGRAEVPLGEVSLYSKGFSPIDEWFVLQSTYPTYFDDYGLRSWVSRKLFRQLLDRLRRLQHSLNDRLLKRKVPLRVIRPCLGWLQLQDTTGRIPALDVEDYDEPNESLAEEEEDGAEHLSPVVPRKQRGMSIEQCCQALKDFLGKGSVPSVELRRFFEGRCSNATLRRALSRLGVLHTKRGFGRTGRWFIMLPNSQGGAK